MKISIKENCKEDTSFLYVIDKLPMKIRAFIREYCEKVEKRVERKREESEAGA